MEVTDIKTQEDMMEYLEEYSDVIAVREQINGKWGSHFLNKLPVKLALKHAFNFVKTGKIPHRMKREEEMPPECKSSPQSKEKQLIERGKSMGKKQK